MDSHSELGSEDNSSARGNTRLLVTHEGLLDQALLRRTEGYMHKKGGAVNARGGFRNWKKRWFVIAPVEILGSQGYELQYFDAPNGNLKGKVGLSEIEILCETKSLHKKVKYEFQIVLQNGGTLELSCDDAQERDEWIETLNMITAYLRKILTTTAMTLDGYDPFDEDDEESFHIGEEIAHNCQAFGPGLFGAEAGTQSQFVVQVHDLMGQQVTKGGMPITATLSNGECMYYMRVIDNEDGTYFSQYMLGRAGKYKLSIRLNDEHDIFGSPFDVEILPSRTIARFCTAHGDALNSIMANETSTFTIIAMDGFGNRKNNGGDPFEVGVMGPAQLKSLVDNADGSYTCTIAAHSPAAASYVTSSSLMILVTLHGKAISGSPFKPIITEDLRSLYASNAANNANNAHAGSAASVASYSPAGSMHSQHMSQQQYQQQQSPYASKHMMAQAPPGPSPYGQSPYGSQSGQGQGQGQHQNSGQNPGPAPDSDLLRDLDLEDLDLASAAPPGSISNRQQQQPQVQAGGQVSSNRSVASHASGAAGRGAPGAGAGGASVASVGNNNSTVGAARPATASPQRSQSGVGVSSSATKPSASAAASANAPATNSAGGGLSRLERSRQRALLAKALSESGGGNASNNNNAGFAPPAPGNYPEDSAGSGASVSGGRKLTKLEEIQRSMAANSIAGAGGAGQGAAPGVSTAAAGTGGGAQINTGNSAAAGGTQQQQQRAAAPRPVSNEFLSSVVNSLQAGLGGGPLLSSNGSVNSGVGGKAGAGTGASLSLGYPANATQNEIKIWDNTQKAFMNEEVVKLLCSHLDVLRQVYDTFSDFVEGVQVIKLATSASQQGGLYRLLELYDVTPTYLSKVEAKVLFTLTLHAQRNLRSPAAVAGGGTGLDFTSFLKFLVMIAYHALSKTNNYSSLYSTIEAKVEVMLFKWALADPLKLQVVGNALRSSAI